MSFENNNKYNYSLELLIEQGRINTTSDRVDISNIITESDKIALDKLSNLWDQITILRKLQYTNIYVEQTIEQLKNTRLKYQPVIEKSDIYENIYNDAKKLETLEVQYNEFML